MSNIIVNSFHLLVSRVPPRLVIFWLLVVAGLVLVLLLQFVLWLLVLLLVV